MAINRFWHLQLSCALLGLVACVDLALPPAVVVDGDAGTIPDGSSDPDTAADGPDAAPPVAYRSGLRADFFAGLDFLTYTGTYFDAVVNQDRTQTARTAAARTGSPSLFSALWTGEVLADVDGQHVFVVNANDGVRLWVGNQMVIDDWSKGAEVREGTFTMSKAAPYPIRMEYFQQDGDAIYSLRWRPPGLEEKVIPSGNLRNATRRAGMPGLRAEFFGDPRFEALSGIFHDTRIAFSAQDFAIVAPARSGADVNFSARWTGMVLADHSETYTFEIDADDSARVWLNGKPVIEGVSGTTKIGTGMVDLQAGTWYDLKVEFVQTYGPGSMFLRWSSPSQVYSLVPTDHLRYPDRED